jgi:hypothetical protein
MDNDEKDYRRPIIVTQDRDEAALLGEEARNSLDGTDETQPFYARN